MIVTPVIVVESVVRSCTDLVYPFMCEYIAGCTDANCMMKLNENT